MVPSDPDFPFEMVGLDCVLHVPAAYPGAGRPSLDVRNEDMGRGYQINVERGFDGLVARSAQPTLLGLMNALDKQLESLLMERRVETVKLVSNSAFAPGRVKRPSPGAVAEAAPATQAHPQVEPAIGTEERAAAASRRDAETHQLDARLGRLPTFSKAPDGTAYDLPIEPRQRGQLPVPLQNVRAVRLLVPPSYPLQPCRIEIQGVSREAAATTETNFLERARKSRETSLMGHLNYLAQNMHVLAARLPPDHVDESRLGPSLERLGIENPKDHAAAGRKIVPNDEDDRSHIVMIPRPPEWVVVKDHGKDQDGSTDSHGSWDAPTDEASDDEARRQPNAAPERGVLVSFPGLELHGVELLEVRSLGITIKCNRCKETMDFKNLHSNADADATRTRSESCGKCASQLGLGEEDARRCHGGADPHQGIDES
jgi:hypothetical protein